jgi:tetratricopeptide (TPR) repeat protein
MTMRTRNTAALLLLTSLGACTTTGTKLAIRPVGKPAAASVAMPVDQRLAEATAELALGNVALALERYRVAARDNPADPRPIQGLAACYERMGRFDLSQRYLEQALALAPRNKTLLAAEQRATAIEARVEAPTVPVAAPPPVVAESQPRMRGPKLVRLSLGEVALVSAGRAPFPAVPLRAIARTAPLRLAGDIRLLNAARRQGLAAATRDRLGQFGWRQLTIGDAPHALAQTVIRYPKEKQTTAVMLALSFRHARLERSDGDSITVLLGRDFSRRGVQSE